MFELIFLIAHYSVRIRKQKKAPLKTLNQQKEKRESKRRRLLSLPSVVFVKNVVIVCSAYMCHSMYKSARDKKSPVRRLPRGRKERVRVEEPWCFDFSAFLPGLAKSGRLASLQTAANQSWEKLFQFLFEAENRSTTTSAAPPVETGDAARRETLSVTQHQNFPDSFPQGRLLSPQPSLHAY